MNKTVTSNIAGFIFHMDENAYHKMEQYLGKIRNYFAGSEGEDEIVSGIEERIAEMFQSKKKEVIGLMDVEEMIGIMGQPEAFMDEDDMEEAAPKKGRSSYGSANQTGSKRVYRDGDDKVLGGVCSGISYYFGINEPLWLRLAFLVALFAGPGFLLYIILWVIIPEASSQSQKLEMKGQKINAENIGKAVSNEMDSVKKKWSEDGDDHPVAKIGQFFMRFISLIGNLVIGILNVFGKIIGFFLIMVGVIGFMGVLSVPLGLPTMISLGNDGGISSFAVQDIVHNLVGGAGMMIWISITGMLVWGIPMLMLAYIGTKLLFKYKSHNKGIFATMGGLWVIGVVMSFAIASIVASDFSSEGSRTETVELQLNNNPDKAILLALNHELGDDEPVMEAEIFDLKLMMSGNSTAIYGKPELDINMANSGGPKLIIKRLARANKKQDAVDRANMIDYGFIVNDTSILLNGYFAIPEDELWRTQDVQLELLLPVGYTVYLSDEMSRIIYDIDNVTNTYDGNMVGRRWTMTPDGLACVDCNGLEDQSESRRDRSDHDSDNDSPSERRIKQAAIRSVRKALRDARRELTREMRRDSDATQADIEDLQNEIEELDRELNNLQEELNEVGREREEEDEEISHTDASDDEDENAFFFTRNNQEDEQPVERILLKRVINASYWVDQNTFRKVTLSYPG